MRKFLVDENLNSKKFYNECDRVGQVDLQRFPQNWLGTPDSKLLPKLSDGVPLVTMDRYIAQQNSFHIPKGFPGIVITTYSAQSGKGTTWKGALKILRDFRAEYPDWENASLVDRVITLTESFILIEKVISKKLVSEGTFLFSTPSWKLQLSALFFPPSDEGNIIDSTSATELLTTPDGKAISNH